MERITLKSLCAALLLLGAGAGQITAQPILRLPSIIGDHMVLQENSNVKIWGWAEPNKEVLIIPSWSQDTVRTKSTGDTKWLASIQTPAADNRTYTLTVQTQQRKIEVKDILVGQVWLCGGQSNMNYSAAQGITDMQEELQKPMNPTIRLFTVTRNSSPWYQEECEGKWQVCNAKSALWFSAVGYFFGKTLSKALSQPVGLINASWGGSPVETWTPASSMSKEPALKGMWTKNRKSKSPYNYTIGSMYNAMIHPITNFALAGIVWYQGEANVGHTSYADAFSLLIDSWRTRFGRDLPFYFVQIAPYKYKHPNSGAEIREQQARVAASKDRTGMVVVSDLVENVGDIHPRRKQEVGRRLANWALAETYGKPGSKYRHATFASITVKGQKAIIAFNNAEGGIVSDGNPAEALEICDASMVFRPARAMIDQKDGSLIVWNDAVRKPVAVRYMFSNEGIGNLKDTAGLPVAPFRTDSPLLAADMAAAELAKEMTLTGVKAEGDGYKSVKLKKGSKLFLNRSYPVNILPERFNDFDMLIREATPGQLSQVCSVTPTADGLVYIIARKNERTAEDLFGWREVKNSEVTYSTSKGDVSLKIFSKKAKAGKKIEIPQTKDFCGITLIAKKIDYTNE